MSPPLEFIGVGKVLEDEVEVRFEVNWSDRLCEDVGRVVFPRESGYCEFLGLDMVANFEVSSVDVKM